jgi:dTDP-4-dehydrorhamnose reductase
VVEANPRRAVCRRTAGIAGKSGVVKILVTGREGQVAQSLVERAAADPQIELVSIGRPQLDLLEPNTVRSVILEAKPDIVVSAAAYTAVDQAEDEPERAHAVNTLGAGAVAAAAAKAGAAVIHLSTDYVFSGDKGGGYRETDQPDPQSVYGRTKLEGERAIAEANPRHLILRTAWVYSPFGKNFVKTMLGLAEKHDSVRVVADQWGNPTSALDIADGILRIAETIGRADRADHYGIFHLAGAGSTNWSGLARQVFAESKLLGGPSAEVEEIATEAYPTRARRPRNSRLSCEKFLDAYGWRAPDWQVSCRTVVERLVKR